VTMSPAVRDEVSTSVGAWKSLQQLLASKDNEVWFDALRVLANLALHPALQAPMISAGVLSSAGKFLPLDDPDLQSQAARLLGNLSACVETDPSAMRALTQPRIVDTVGAACIKATASNEGAGNPACPDFARAYSGASCDDVRVQLSAVIARCLKERLNQRIFLELLSTLDHTDENFRKLPTRQQRALLLREKEALSTGTEVREVINQLLHERQSNPQVLLHYADALETLTHETSNHQPMYVKSYIQQLVGVANEANDSLGPTQATAFRALYNILEAEGADNIHSLMLRAPMNVAPTLMRAAYTGHEPTQIEICRIMRAFGRHDANAARLVQQKHHTAEGQVPFLEVISMMLQTASIDLQVAICAALAPYAARQKVEVCRAKLVGPLITLSQSSNAEVVDAAGAVLSSLA